MTQETRNGDYIRTRSGRHFYPIDPRVDDFYLEDVAHSLSQVNRSCGHTERPYSVGQHSVLISWILEDMGYDERTQFIGLTHDISEYVLNDIPSPLKAFLPDYAVIEKRVQDLAYMWAGLGEVTEEEYAAVHRIDKALFPLEANCLLNTEEEVPDEIKQFERWLVPNLESPWGPELTKEQFLKRFHELSAFL